MHWSSTITKIALMRNLYGLQIGEQQLLHYSPALLLFRPCAEQSRRYDRTPRPGSWPAPVLSCSLRCADGLLEVLLESCPVLQLLPPALVGQEHPGDALVVGVGLAADGARLLQTLQDARDPRPRQMERLGEVALAHPVVTGKQAKREDLAVVRLGVREQALHGLPMQVEDPAKGLKGSAR